MNEEFFTEEQAFALLPARKPDAHKGDFGTLCGVLGCEHYRGAAVLATMGALRVGCGIVQLASVEACCTAVAAHLWEPIYLPLHAKSGGIFPKRQQWHALSDAARRASALLIGCGCGRGEGMRRVLERLLWENPQKPVVLDADALFFLAQSPALWHIRKAPLILTPHFGEMARLCGESVEQIARDPVRIATDFVATHPCVLVLKGPHTVIAAPDGTIVRNSTGNAGLAKGGSGDVLAGMIAGFCAQGIAPTDAAKLGVWLHGAAADKLVKETGYAAFLPSLLGKAIADVLCAHAR